MKKGSIYEKSIRTKREVSESAFYFLFSEIVQFCLKKDRNHLERQLEEIGYPLGARFLELVCFRDRSCKKETSIVNILLFIKNSIWPVVFNKQISSVEQHAQLSHIYMLKEENSICNKYACLPRGPKSVNCSAFTAGMIEGILNASGFPSKVCAVYESDEIRGEETVEKTTYIIYFAPEVVEREMRRI